MRRNGMKRHFIAWNLLELKEMEWNEIKWDGME